MMSSFVEMISFTLPVVYIAQYAGNVRAKLQMFSCGSSVHGRITKRERGFGFSLQGPLKEKQNKRLTCTLEVNLQAGRMMSAKTRPLLDL